MNYSGAGNKKLFLGKSYLLAVIMYFVGLSTLVGQHLDPAQLEGILTELSNYFGVEEIKPDLEIRQGLPVPARYTHKPQPVIEVDAHLPTYLNETFQEQAPHLIAFILAHELVHHYHKHPPDRQSSEISYEIEADSWGGFYAHAAGYTLDSTMVSRLLKDLYTYYQLDATDAGYPSLSERTTHSLRKIQEIQTMQLGGIFRAVQFLNALGNFKAARLCLEFIFNRGFKSAAMRNDLSVAYMREILSTPAFQKQIFAYPFDFERPSQLRTVSGSGTDTERIFYEAETRLREAIEMDKNYESAYINLALLLIIRQKYASALETLGEYEKKSADSNKTSRIHLVKALAYAYMDDASKAIYYFEQATSMGDQSAMYNYQIYRDLITLEQPFSLACQKIALGELRAIQENSRHQVFPLRSGEASIISATNELQVFQIQGGYTAQNLSYQTIVIHHQNPFLELGFAAPQSCFNSWKIKLKELNKSTSIMYLHTTLPNFTQSSAGGIRIGDTESKLTQAAYYGSPSEILDNFYVYPSGNIIFEMIRQKVYSWTVFQF